MFSPLMLNAWESASIVAVVAGVAPGESLVAYTLLV